MRVATALRIVSVVTVAKTVLIGVVYWRRAEILGRPVHIGAGSWACLMARKPESSPNSPAPSSPPSRPSHPTSTHSSGDSDPSSSRLHPRCSTCTAAPPEQPPASWGKPQTSHDSAANPPLSATRDWPRCRTGQAVHMAGCAHTKEATDASTAPCIRRPWCASKLAARGPTNTAGAANPILIPGSCGDSTQAGTDAVSAPPQRPRRIRAHGGPHRHRAAQPTLSQHFPTVVRSTPPRGTQRRRQPSSPVVVTDAAIAALTALNRDWSIALGLEP